VGKMLTAPQLATNRIVKILDEKVIQEISKDKEAFKGTSISVYNSNTKTWHQAWPITKEAILILMEEWREAKSFQNQDERVNGNKVFQRMCFTILNMTPSTGIGKAQRTTDKPDVAMADKLHEIKRNKLMK